MKKFSLLFILVLLSISSFSDYTLTRGPNIGEIYYIGPTYTGLGIYHSYDYGSSAICVDSTTNATGITADLTNGVLYYRNMGEALYISYNHGQQGTWQIQNGGIYPGFASGRTEGEINNIFVSHSEDFGQTFITHAYNGFFGNYFESEIDNQTNIGYVLTYKSNVADSVYLLKSIDNYENLYLNKTFIFNWNDAISLTRGASSGELYLFNHDRELLLLSYDYANTWINLNNFNFGDFYGLGIVGGRTDGELYIKCDYVNMMWQNAHTYILHSIDYGVTFEVFNPFSKGQMPLLANFSAKNIEGDNLSLFDYDSTYFVVGEMPLDVQFYNYSIGDINNFEWDFDNDGVVDSYEQSPIYTYADTGWYSVNLTVFDGNDTNSFLRENYVYVDKATGISNNNTFEISCFPNPFSDYINIIIPQVYQNRINKLIIYNNSGEIIRMINTNENKIIWDGKNSSNNNCPPGIYFLKINDHKTSNKILLTK
ncbi:MAG: T9SS type A sorting domain-containing protein [Bacteroidales bacterium]|nr:T9SS type A sorting domain-containing protein [Bacteroidales bacterium]